MISFIKIAVHIFIVMAAGFVFLRLIRPRLRLTLNILALLYGLGIGLISLEMFFLSLAGFHFSLALILFPWCAGLAYLLIFRRQDLLGVHLQEEADSGIRFWEPVFFLAITLPFLLKAVSGLPFVGWDAWAHWGLKAKIFYLEKHIPLNFYTDTFSIIPLRDYPLLVPLMETFFFQVLGRFDDVLVKAVFFMFYLSLLVYFYSLVKMRCGKWQAGVYTFVLATVPALAEFACGYYVGYADLVFAYFNFASVTLLWLWLLKGRQVSFYLSALFAGFALWTKQEGIVLIAANLCALFLAGLAKAGATGRAKPKFFIIYALIPLAINVPWYSLVFLSGFSFVHLGSYAYPPELLLRRFPLFLYALWKHLLDFSSWNVIWLVFISLLFLRPRAICGRDNRFICVNLLIQMAFYTVIVLMDYDFSRVLMLSLPRLLLHLVPLLLLAVSAVTCHKTAEVFLDSAAGRLRGVFWQKNS
jgi:hypothetical protein